MVRTIVYFFIGVVVLGTIATPGLGAFALVLAPLLGLGLLWRVALSVSTHGRTSDAVVRTRTSHLLGPGGPDDTFAASALDPAEYLADAPARTSVRAPNGRVRGANVPRSGLSKAPSVRPAGASSTEGRGG